MVVLRGDTDGVECQLVSKTEANNLTQERLCQWIPRPAGTKAMLDIGVVDMDDDHAGPIPVRREDPKGVEDCQGLVEADVLLPVPFGHFFTPHGRRRVHEAPMCAVATFGGVCPDVLDDKR